MIVGVIGAGQMGAGIAQVSAGAGHEVLLSDIDIARAEAFEPIGVSCRICERRNCHQRAVPPLKRRLVVDPNTRKMVPYGLE